MSEHYFFIGIGGSGMSSLAQIIRQSGHNISGSDRSYDRGQDQPAFAGLIDQGVTLYPQDGSGITSDLDAVIVSSAIEEDNPDLKKARDLALEVQFRSDLLAGIFNRARGLAVAGSSGKSTITAMAAMIMDAAGLDPTVINGAIIPEYRGPNGLGNAKKGHPPYMLIETDESDGSIVKFQPEIGILANISKDHKPLPVLMEIFSRFVGNISKKVIANADCPYTRALIGPLPPAKVTFFGFGPESAIRAEGVSLGNKGSTFRVQGVPFYLPVLGKHNIANALAAIALGLELEIPLDLVSRALKGFSGVGRRLELVGEARGVQVFDDFSHNPAKIRAAVDTLKNVGNRLILVYQPHGFGPTRFLFDELVETFNTGLGQEDILILLDIYYIGGTADQSIASADLLREIAIPQVENLSDRSEVIARVVGLSRPGDVVVVMGARDNSLSALARTIFQALSNQISSSIG